MKTSSKLTALGLTLLSFFSHNAIAEKKLTVYCSVQHATCEKMVQRFSENYNINAQFVRNSTGATLAKLIAEKNNPQADIWYGGTIEHHFQAGDLGLLAPYRSPRQAEIMPQFKTLIDKHGELTSIVYLLVLGFGVNTEKLKQLGITEPPKCWSDLLDPRLQGYVQMPDPQISGTTYTAIATLMELWGEQKAFEYLKKLNANVSEYVKSALVTTNLSRGESAVAVGFIHSYATEKEKGAPVESILPCEGDGYSLGGMSIIKNARNLDNAKLFADWALSKEAQELVWRETKVYQIPTNIHAEASPQSVSPKHLKLISYDFDRFGKSSEGKRLTDKWLKEVKLAK
ncbi:ABC transporter substrate-binding protein [Pasteurella canis]|uniref:Bacterial extracellular solute-binding, family 1 protein n=1 Tax=Pasteurella canis TaxID=753 RepID=A0A379ESW1_9PAST|nr:ABC transporter substrate-binding protein [Pasteurella canis]MXN88532.1 extracellular solute-binding protein [Pasteurella canis]UAX42436.1 ABC transporter substrate-binding protein [Pasteurella canis]UAY77992.1 ABC transporter substrate-binding protein [Pasteurella canis]UDW84060.1 ABC transporter substrate-binding protein [Pasteurella canis]SUC09185.1 bacterial extracellular solute-binding, family 1 protein [Pasteurella canis]